MHRHGTLTNRRRQRKRTPGGPFHESRGQQQDALHLPWEEAGAVLAPSLCGALGQHVRFRARRRRCPASQPYSWRRDALLSPPAPRSASIVLAGQGLSAIPVDALRDHAPHVTSLDLTDNALM